ncbi:MAG: branched-chain-amino-acid transaminase [Verrucomicrobiia bacterium]
MTIFLDGKYVSEEEAKVSVFDHGLLYGDGVFEGIRVYGGKIFRLEQHLDRLFASAKAIMLEMPMTRQQLVEACCRTCARNKLQDGYIRLVVTRGVGNLGLDPFRCRKPSVFIIADKIELYTEEVYRKGIELITAATQRVNVAAISPSIKSLNYLNNILAKIEAIHAGTIEAIMLNSAGYVAECTGDNLFIVRAGRLETPPVSDGALVGITRAVILELAAKLKIAASETHLTRYDLMTADECFLTGTAAEIAPVATIDCRPIGSGKPGLLTLKLMSEFRKLTCSEGTPITPS